MNSIINFTETLTYKEKMFVNFNKFITVPDEVFNTNRYFYYITVPNDTRLDIISVKEYNTNIYMDLIFVVNKMTSMFDLPRNDSYLKNIIDERYSYYKDTLQITDTRLLQTIYQNLVEKFTKENELYRNLRIVKPDYVNEVIGIIKDGNRI